MDVSKDPGLTLCPAVINDVDFEFHDFDIKTKDLTKTEDYGPTSLVNINAKTLHNVVATKLSNTLKGSYTTIKWDLTQGCKDGLTPANQST